MAHESDTSSLKTSLLLNQQVPEFVREEHPLFISFLEAYYEFLETEQGTQNNDLTKTAKDLRFIQDVDDSIASFESNFLNTYANLVPKDAVADKAFLIKNILPIYLAKGNKKSFDFLFRLLYGEEADVRFPKDEILRASDGEYNVERVRQVQDQERLEKFRLEIQIIDCIQCCNDSSCSQETSEKWISSNSSCIYQFKST